MLGQNYEKAPEENFSVRRGERIKRGEEFGLIQREKKANKKKKHRELKKLKKGEAWF